MPVCPHCDEQIDQLRRHVVKGRFFTRATAMFCCPACDKVLGTSVVL